MSETTNSHYQPSPKILLVDDYMPFLNSINFVLQEEGYEVHIRNNGVDAIRAFSEVHPDLVLLDLELPDMDGLEVCYALKQHPFAQHIPVLVLTARTEEEGLTRAFEAGADDFLTKPIFIPGLLARVRSHLRSKGLFEQLEADRSTLQQILEIAGTILNASPEQDVFQELIHQLSLMFGASRVSLVFPDSNGEQLRVVTTSDIPAIQEIQVPLWKYPEVQKSLQTKEVILVHDTKTDELLAPFAPTLEQAQVGSILVIPVISKDGAHGALLLKRASHQTGFSERDVWLCRLIAHAVAALLRNYDLRRSIELTLTQLKETRDRLLQSEKLSSLGQFVAGIAHELNNPLTGIISFSQLLLRSHHSPFVRQSLSRIAQEAERCRRLVRNLLTFSRTNSSEKEPVSINSVVEQIIESHANQLRTAQVRLEMALSPSLPPVLGTVHHFEQILVNLIENALAALAHASSNPCLKILTVHDQDTVQLIVSDNGPGMRREVKERIFEPFFTTKVAGAGTGLGMSIVKGIIEECKGQIEIESEPGHGATFLMKFPAIHAYRKATNSLASTKLTIQGQGRSILLIDDEPAILEALSNFLKLQHFEVFTAESGEKAIDLLQKHRFDAVVMDQRLSDMDGLDLYKKLTQIAPELQRHVAFTSGDGLNPSIRALVDDRQCQFLSKPFTFDELSEILSLTLGKPSSESALQTPAKTPQPG